MKIHTLLSHFSSHTNVPIDPDDVAGEIKKAGIADEISFIAVDLEVRVLRGALHSYVLTDGVYGPPVIYSDIYHARDLTRAWKRLVCCKELLHTLDATVSQTSQIAEMESLIDGLCRVADPTDSLLAPEGIQLWNDKLMVYYAIAILFPIAVRELLIPVYKAGLMKTEQIADRLDLPESAIKLVLSDGWPGLYRAMAGKY